MAAQVVGDHAHPVAEHPRQPLEPARVTALRVQADQRRVLLAAPREDVKPRPHRRRLYARRRRSVCDGAGLAARGEPLLLGPVARPDERPGEDRARTPSPRPASR